MNELEPVFRRILAGTIALAGLILYAMIIVLSMAHEAVTGDRQLPTPRALALRLPSMAIVPATKEKAEQC